MATTNFTAIYANDEGKIIERKIPGMNTYKIAEKFAIMLNDPEKTKLFIIVTGKHGKCILKKMKKPKKRQNG